MTQTTITDQANLTLFLLPWHANIAKGSEIPRAVAREIVDSAFAVEEGYYEVPFHMDRYERISDEANDKIIFGGASVTITSWTNWAPCANSNKPHYKMHVQGYIDIKRIMESRLASEEAKEHALLVAIEMLNIMGPMAPRKEIYAEFNRAMVAVGEAEKSLNDQKNIRKRIPSLHPEAFDVDYKIFNCREELHDSRMEFVPCIRELALADWP